MAESKIKISVTFDSFLLDCASRRLTDGTLKFYRSKLTPFFRWLEAQGITHIQDIQAAHIREYLASLADRGLTDQYAHDIGRAIRAWLNYCIRDDLLDKSPFDRVKLPKLAKKAPKTLSDEEVKRILDTCSTRRDEAICLLLLDTGIRASELCALNIGDVNQKTGAVTVR